MTEGLFFQGDLLIDSRGIEVNVDGVIADSGMTSVVYRGSVEGKAAAIKLLRPAASKIVREYFRSERMNMIALKAGWEKQYPDEKSVVPEVFAFNDEGEFPFIAMELIEGTPIDDYVYKMGALTEKQALEVGSQFGKLLHVLHTEAHQTYVDIKLDNLWILKSDSADSPLKLMVLDWNILANYSEEGVDRDLFFASLYLIRMVLNDTPGTRGTRIHGPIEQLSRFNALTLAMQLLLRQLLNNNLSYRPRKAVEWVEALQENYSLWIEPPGVIRNRINEITRTLNNNPEENNLSQADISELYNSIKIDLQILLARVESDEEAAKIKSELEEIQVSVEKYSNLDIGLTFLRGGNFDQAIDRFLKGAELSPIDREKLLRWYWCSLGSSQIGREVFQTIRDEIIKIVEFHVAGEYRRVLSGFKTIQIEKLPPAWQFLHDEAEIYVLEQKAEQAKLDHKYDEAVEYYGKCIELKENFPVQPATWWIEYLPDLHELYKEASRLAQTTGRFYQLLEDADEKHQEGDYLGVVNALRLALSTAPEEKYRVREKWISKVKECLIDDDKNAHIYIDHGIATAYIQDSIKPYYLFNESLRNAEASLSIGKVMDAFHIMKAFWERQIDDPEDLIARKTDEFIRKLYKHALDKDNFELVSALLSFADMNRLDWAQDEFKKVFDRAIETKIGLILYLTQEETLHNYREAVLLIDQLMSYGDSDHRKISDKLEVFKQIRTKKAELEASYSTKEKRIAELRHDIDAIIAQLEEINQFKDYLAKSLTKLSLNIEEEIDDDVIPGLNRKYVTLVGQAFALTDEYSKLMKDVDAVEATKYLEILFEYVDRSATVLPTLFDVFSTRKDTLKISNLESLIIKKAKENFEAGSPEKAIEWLNISRHGGPLNEEEQEIFTLSEKAISLRRLKSAEEFEHLELAYYGGLPSVYWSGLSYVVDYYKGIIEKDLLRLRELSTNSTEFAQLLSSIVNYQKRIDQMQMLAGDERNTNTTVELLDVVKAAVSYNKSPTHQNEKLLLQTIGYLPYSKYATEDFNNLLRRREVGTQKRDRTKLFRLTTMLFIILFLVGAASAAFLFLFPEESRDTLRDTFGLSHPNEESLRLTQTHVIELGLIATQASLPTPSATVQIDDVVIPISPTATPTSAFDVANNFLPNQPWIFPAHGDIRFIIDSPMITYEGPTTIQSITGHGYSDNFRILSGGEGSVGPINIVWALDTEIVDHGLYEIFVSDPLSFGGFTSSRVKYAVYQGEERILPLNGDGLVAFSPSDQQTFNEWNSLGVYELINGQPIRVEINEEDLFLDEGEVFPIDSVLLLKIADPDLEIPLVRDLVEVKETKIIYWIDDRQASREPSAGWVFGPDDEEERHLATWDGESQITLSNVVKEVSLTWHLPHRLWGAGNKYKIGVWVSPNIQTPVEYELFINGQSRGDIITIDPETDLGLFIYFNVFEIPDDLRYSIRVDMRANWPHDDDAEDFEYIVAGDVVIVAAIENFILDQ
jgi:hypothetical protein